MLTKMKFRFQTQVLEDFFGFKLSLKLILRHFLSCGLNRV